MSDDLSKPVPLYVHPAAGVAMQDNALANIWRDLYVIHSFSNTSSEARETPVTLIRGFARMMFARPTDDDTDPRLALLAVFDLFDPKEQKITDLLERAVHALESAVGRAYSPLGDLISAQSLVDLGTAGERSTVRPEDVPEELRALTIKFWQDKHAQWSEQFMLLAARMIEATKLLIEWRDARENIFQAGDKATSEMLTRLGAAELALMTYARALDG